MAKKPAPKNIRALEKAASKNPRIWRRIKVGAVAGLAVTLFGLGYRQNVIDAVTASRVTQQQVAKVLREEYDPRSGIDKLLGKPAPPEISVGKTILTKRDAQGRITSIGKVRILKGAPNHMQLAPRIAANAATAKYAGVGALAGAAFGAASGIRGKWRRRSARKQLQNMRRR